MWLPFIKLAEAQTLTDISQVPLIQAIEQASIHWQLAFNTGDAAACSHYYEDNAIMQADPFGTFIGRKSIQAFWQQLIDDGFTDVRYIAPTITVVDDNTGLLTAKWTMNNAHGIITKELWVLQEDGSAKLREDLFEAQD